MIFPGSIRRSHVSWKKCSPARNRGSFVIPCPGTDLFAHTAKSGSVYYYLWHWSEQPNETNICQLTTEESAKLYIQEQCGGSVSATGLDHDAPEVHLPGKGRAVVKWD